jgi:hypothetical protein
MAQTVPGAAAEAKWLMRLFSHPLVGMTGTVAGVLGLVLSVYFYVQSDKKPDFVCLVNPAQAVVVKTGESSALHVFFGDRELKSDVTAAQVAIWNRGNESIRPENILDQVTLCTNPQVPILEAVVRKKSRSVVDVSLDQSKLSSGVVGVKWNILEQGDGAIVQLVYAGPPSTQIQITGVIERQNQIRELKERPVKERTFESNHFLEKAFGYIGILLGMVLLVMSLVVGRYAGSRRLTVYVGISLAYVAIGFFFLSLSPSGPPFGF